MNEVIKKKHIGVYGILTKNNQILLVHKTRGPYTGQFDLPGGGLKHGEKVIDALLREIAEEIGLKLSKNDVSLWNNVSTTVYFEEANEKVSFFHIGLIYLIHNFDQNTIKQNICVEDVKGSLWIPLSRPLEQLSPFAEYVIKKINKNES